ncbi:DNA topoisomerase IV subunit B [Candidatus Phycosocius spiralis]|uniref:DNA topoisomerase 4 subunit B n=1 Tax=Candidatus Phycosocius spiralis TaxID=2815099 RepID=A0ABQ4PSD3_9PROT|nr:DNA topoisomerase IV subunit B [Candidatus Phycosocius spiralis]GIU65907.1 DNA topoisomerase 4 subunit B [Candidatus Phycosocius spiralis]
MASNAAPNSNLFDQFEPESTSAGSLGYSAKDIEVLEGLEPVRKRPGMYIGGTDARAMHHLFAEVLDNAMDEVVAGHATWIEVTLEADGALAVGDNGRGIPIDPHPKYVDKSALEVVMTVLHAGGKFSDKAYQTSGGLHGVGVSVVNALSNRLEVEVARDKRLYRMQFSRGMPQGPIEHLGPIHNRRGSVVRFHPDPEIFGEGASFDPARLFRMARSKAYLFRGVEIRWKCAPERIKAGDHTPIEEILCFPNGLADYLHSTIGDALTVTSQVFAGRTTQAAGHGGVEWAMTWGVRGFGDRDGFLLSYCNTIPTPEGGTHEQGLRGVITKGLRNYGELVGDKKAAQITAEDVFNTAAALVSVFVREPEFVGQTKDRLATAEAARIVENAIRDPFDHWLGASPREARALLDWAIAQADDRMKRRKEKEVQRQSATRKLRLPGKLADCARQDAIGTEIFIVEGDSAGGSAKQARDRTTQAILPLRGKILNVASAGGDKLAGNQELSDLALALGVAPGAKFRLQDLRYERIIIMTDADVDGAHIAALLATYFFRAMPQLVHAGRLFVALPPLYRLTHNGKTLYAKNDAHKDELLKTAFGPRAKVEVGRFKGLGEMMPAQLKLTTMNPATRTLARLVIPEGDIPGVGELVETLMGRKPELRFKWLQENARYAEELDV